MPCDYEFKHKMVRGGEAVLCQFRVPEDDLIEFEDRKWCKFHLPFDGESGLSPKGNWDGLILREFDDEISKIIKNDQKFAKTTNFTGVVFPRTIDFSDIFNSVVLTVNFSGSIFCGYASFGRINFGNSSNFTQCTFMSNANFHECSFPVNANFPNCKFHGPAFFTNAKLGSSSIFLGSKFYAMTDFSRNLKFSEAMRNESEDERLYDFPKVNFSNAAFQETANFSNRRFSSQTIFVDVLFRLAPRFHNCEFHQDTDFSGAKFPDKKSGWSARAYRTLKLAMEGHRARTEEAMFYALEQESIRHQPDTPLAVKVFSLAYQWGSDYGRNFVLPLAWLICFGGVFAVAYNQLGFSTSEVLSFTVQQYVRPFWVWENKDISDGIKLLASFQSLIGLGLVTLFVLAVRRRFRMG